MSLGEKAAAAALVKTAFRWPWQEEEEPSKALPLALGGTGAALAAGGALAGYAPRLTPEFQRAAEGWKNLWNVRDTLPREEFIRQYATHGSGLTGSPVFGGMSGSEMVQKLRANPVVDKFLKTVAPKVHGWSPGVQLHYKEFAKGAPQALYTMLRENRVDPGLLSGVKRTIDAMSAAGHADPAILNKVIPALPAATQESLFKMFRSPVTHYGIATRPTLWLNELTKHRNLGKGALALGGGLAAAGLGKYLYDKLKSDD